MLKNKGKLVDIKPIYEKHVAKDCVIKKQRKLGKHEDVKDWVEGIFSDICLVVIHIKQLLIKYFILCI